jgi:hypothetical protein
VKTREIESALEIDAIGFVIKNFVDSTNEKA